MPYIRNFRASHPDRTFSANYDFAGRCAFNTSFGDQIQSIRIDDLSVQFKYNIATEDAASATSGTGTVSAIAGSLAEIASGTTASSTASLTSRHFVRYRPGHDGYVYVTAAFVTPPTVAAGFARVGPHDANGGYWFGYSGTTFGVARRVLGVDTFVGQSDFNLDKLDGTGPSNFTLRPNTVNLFHISWGWLGIAPVFFHIYGGQKRGWIPFHVFDLANKSTALSTQDPIQPLAIAVANGAANTTNVKVQTGSWNAGTTGSDYTIDAFTARYFTANNAKSGVSTITSIFGLSNPATFQSKTNKVLMQLTSLSMRDSSAPEIIIQLHRNPTVTSASYATAIDAVNSVMLMDTAGGAVTNVGKVELHTCISGNTGSYIDITNDRILIYPGETLHVSVTSTTTAVTTSMALRWREYF